MLWLVARPLWLRYIFVAHVIDFFLSRPFIVSGEVCTPNPPNEPCYILRTILEAWTAIKLTHGSQ